MTQQLIDREVVKQLVVALESNWAPRSTNYSEDFNARKSALAAGRAALANAEPTGCTWTKDPDFEMGDTYDSSCGEKWSFIDGGPTENRVRFCQGCGKPVKLIKDTL